jgi:hypothetical protein
MEEAPSGSSLGRKLIALVVLAIAGFILLKVLIHAIIWALGFVIVIAAIVAVLWALNALL